MLKLLILTAFYNYCKKYYFQLPNTKLMHSNNPTFRNKLRNYSILAGSALAAVSTADGQIVHHDISPNVILNTPGETYNLDLNGDGTADVQFFQSHSFHYTNKNGFFLKNNASFAGTIRLFHSGGSTVFPLGFPSVINAGSKIGSDRSWGSYSALKSGTFEDNCILAGSSYSGIYRIGDWRIGETDKFIGLRIKSGSGYNYGWMRCTEAPGAKSITLIDYAYQTTPNMPIIAGDTGCSTEQVFIVAFNKNLRHGDTTRLKMFNVQPGDTYDWFRGSKKIAMTKYLHSIVVSEPGEYWAKIKSPEGCVSVSDTIEVRDLSGLPQTDELSTFMDGDLQNLYSADKILHVKLSNASYLQDGEIRVFNSVGENVLQQNISSLNFTVNLQSLGSGIYFVKLTNGKSEINREVFVE